MNYMKPCCFKDKAIRSLVSVSLALSPICHSEVIKFGNLEGVGGNTFQIVFSSVENPGNPSDTTGKPNPCGAVSYNYSIGTYEINRNIINRASHLGITLWDLTANGGNGDNRPATGITWYEAAIFVNYLNTSRGLSPAYKFVNGVFQLWVSGDVGYDPSNPYRNSKANYFIPNANEWYKAAYYDPNKGGAGIGGYWRYATKSDTIPNPVSGGTDQNTAVYLNQTSPADVTNAGGLSAYGTMAQDGNVWEWNENALDLINNLPDKHRIRRGSSFSYDSGFYCGSADFMNLHPSQDTYGDIGLRVVRIPQNTETNPQVYSSTVSSNVAQGKVVTASSVYENNANFSADRVVNGSTSETSGSFWMAKGTGDIQRGTLPAWILIDLGQTYPITGLSLLNAKNAPYNDRGTKEISIQTSPDGTTYTTIVSAATLAWQNTSFQEQPFPTVVSARYVKINITSTYGSWGSAALNEVRINSPQLLVTSYTLVTTADQTKGSITVTPNQPNYLDGDLVTVSVSPLSGYVFSGWSGDITGNATSVALTMDSNKGITANFGQDARDNDADGLSNYLEIVTYGTNPNQKDSNSDGIEDGQAVTLGYSPTFNFSALISHLQSHPPTGLYTASQMQAMAIGDLVLTKNANGSFVLNYDIEQSTDLQRWLPYQSFSQPLTDLPPDKAFLRIKAKQ